MQHVRPKFTDIRYSICMALAVRIYRFGKQTKPLYPHLAFLPRDVLGSGQEGRRNMYLPTSNAISGSQQIMVPLPGLSQSQEPLVFIPLSTHHLLEHIILPFLELHASSLPVGIFRQQRHALNLPHRRRDGKYHVSVPELEPFLSFLLQIDYTSTKAMTPVFVG